MEHTITALKNFGNGKSWNKHDISFKIKEELTKFLLSDFVSYKYGYGACNLNVDENSLKISFECSSSCD